MLSASISTRRVMSLFMFARRGDRKSLLVSSSRLFASDSSSGGDMGSDSGGGSITYSGGQATTGQGGFYGAGGARAYVKAQTKHRPEAVAHAADIKSLRTLMEEVIELESELNGTKELSKQIQIKASIRKKVAGREMTDLLKRLELKGQPVWGLSVSERSLVKEARRLFNQA